MLAVYALMAATIFVTSFRFVGVSYGGDGPPLIGWLANDTFVFFIVKGMRADKEMMNKARDSPFTSRSSFVSPFIHLVEVSPVASLFLFPR